MNLYTDYIYCKHTGGRCRNVKGLDQENLSKHKLLREKVSETGMRDISEDPLDIRGDVGHRNGPEWGE